MSKYEDNFDESTIVDTPRINAAKFTQKLLEDKLEQMKSEYRISGGGSDCDGSIERSRGVITQEQYEHFTIARLAVREAKLNLQALYDGNTIKLREAKEDDFEKERVHESYGMISMSRINSSHDTPFFGSKLKCRSWISIRINTGSHRRSLNHDWYHANKQIVDIRLTPSQFAEFITGMNQGDGFPCTINNFMGRSMDNPPHYSKIEEFNDEFKAKIMNNTEAFSTLLEDVKALKATGTISKSKREEIAGRISSVAQDIQSNMPYVAKCFSEHMDATTSEFKQEAEAYLNTMITHAGIASLKRDNFPVIESDDIKSIN